MEMHVRSLEAFRAFGQGLGRRLVDLREACELVRLDVLEACAWIDRCLDAASQQVGEASAEVDRCEDALSYCESQEDEEYIPDCSAERSDLDDALHELREARRRRKRIAQLQSVLYQARTRVLHEAKDFQADVAATGNRGAKYLASQARAIEEILKLRGPKA